MARPKLSKPQSNEVRKNLMNPTDAVAAKKALVKGLEALDVNQPEDREALTRLIEGTSEIEAALEIEFMPEGTFAGVQFGEDA